MFASKYREEINRNPHFRDKFNNLCSDLGVEAIVCNYLYFNIYNEKF